MFSSGGPMRCIIDVVHAINNLLHVVTCWFENKTLVNDNHINSTLHTTDSIKHAEWSCSIHSYCLETSGSVNWFLWHQYCTICLILWSLHSLWLDYCIMIVNDVSSWSRSISTVELRRKALSVSFLLTSQSRLIYKISIFTDLYTHTLLAWRRAPSCFDTSGQIAFAFAFLQAHPVC